MRKIEFSFRIILLSVLLFNSGCAHCIASEQEDMYTLASALTKLTSAVEEKVLFKEAPPEMKDMALIDLSVMHDPRLKEAFTEYVLKARSVNGHAVVLVCDERGRSGLLEDGGCSSVMDHHWWRDQPGHPCEVSNAICLKK
ncbi:hypothetical protein [Citrifermentans bremense]|uniref:hypothetical protein n=1 Tax=Citrifermentans bremense TaxID=60035 RepID=UPI000686B0CE|nr:hypothetical protein [Citrifermentans bremense]